MSTLLEALRKTTSEQHTAIHHHPLLVSCQKQRLNKKQYSHLLKAFYTPWMMLLSAIDKVPVAALKPRLVQRAQALENDLANLSISISATHTRTKPLIMTERECLGACYVLVGSSLGANILVDSIKASLPTAPISYFSCSPKEAGWPILASHLGSLTPQRRDDACVAAHYFFQIVYAELSEHRCLTGGVSSELP
ncbi:MAG: biliverdin-producing heme oxygenase [Cellvibrionaceae bacterium]|nr:biliverdin-producing heme oxygenase [Cellvibrionaceae bacterium]